MTALEQPTNRLQRLWVGLLDTAGPRAAALARLRRGVLYGLWIGALFGLTATTIDVLTIHDLPLRIEWPLVLQRTILFGTIMAALMAVVSWPPTYWRGTLLGAAVIAFSVIVAAVAQAARQQLQNGWLALLFLLPSYSVLSIPLAALLRWIVHQHEASLESQPLYRWLTQIGLVILVGLASAWAGTWLKMSDEAHAATRRVRQLVDDSLALSSDGELPFVLKNFSTFRARAGVPYYLTQQADPFSLEGFDVTAKFDDGYRLTCLALLRPTPSVLRCAEAESLY